LGVSSKIVGTAVLQLENALLHSARAVTLQVTRDITLNVTVTELFDDRLGVYTFHVSFCY